MVSSSDPSLIKKISTWWSALSAVIPRRKVFHACSGLLDCKMMPSFIKLFYYSKSLLPILHFEQSVCKFSKIVSPPFAHALIWSTWRIMVGSVAGDLPQFFSTTRKFWHRGLVQILKHQTAYLYVLAGDPT